ncbi:MAG TPA: allophanate hydrolase [Methylophaga aminisulfidivorans]|uniref:Allophanate hydrolase n=1 Tax=Methylophaga aminisulfidivorans TaxID=230105 RepID=A0A7C1VVT1_9GAMM|nr:allophanate hydrolase [Methylophaga aminisulfidivorans]
MTQAINLTIPALHKAYKQGELSPEQMVVHVLELAKQYLEHNIWIRLFTRAEIQPYLDALKNADIADKPLYGIPFAIKDNIDLAGFPVTAGCEAYAYTPEKSAFVVQQLIDAGAIPIGKTNLDQFATGLVGVRSPEKWGPCHNSFNPDYISGGSSSGSAVSVALGLVSFALGTDTAGSGRVPAAFNNLVGLKPTRGLLSTDGVVPACKSLDCVSIFSLTTDDANSVYKVAAVFDTNDAYARLNIDTNIANYGSTQARFSFAVPEPEQLTFFGNHEYEKQFEATVVELEKLGGEKQVIDFAPFITAARLLYEGPWVAERRVATEGVDRSNMLSVIQDILSTQEDASADDLFKAEYALQACRQQVRSVLESVDFIVTPTAGTTYTIDEVQAEPIKLNSNLGHYTNFMNLLDCCAVAVPAGFVSSGMPFGITLFSRAFSDSRLLSYANLLQQQLQLPLGAIQQPLAETYAVSGGVDDRILVAVCGAHLDGQPLNHQLTDRGGKLVEKTTTSPSYQLYALAGGPPERPALVRDDNGQAIEIELWQIPTATLGSFLAGIAGPLGLGKVETLDGRWVTGFICEHQGITHAENISAFNSWRNYITNK